MFSRNRRRILAVLHEGVNCETVRETGDVAGGGSRGASVRHHYPSRDDDEHGRRSHIDRGDDRDRLVRRSVCGAADLPRPPVEVTAHGEFVAHTRRLDPSTSPAAGTGDPISVFLPDYARSTPAKIDPRKPHRFPRKTPPRLCRMGFLHFCLYNR